MIFNPELLDIRIIATGFRRRSILIMPVPETPGRDIDRPGSRREPIALNDYKVDRISLKLLRKDATFRFPLFDIGFLPDGL